MLATLETCSTIPEVIELYENTQGDDDFNTDVVFRIAELIAEDDDDLVHSLEYHGLMIEASNSCDVLIGEILEAIAALDDAYDAEEWDQITYDAFADMESDEAMADAAAEVDDVNVLLNEFKGFLHDIGENVTELYGSDFDFGFSDMMNEAFFGDFWGSEMNMDKIVQARGQMQQLLEKITKLEVRFTSNVDETETEIQERVDEEWQKFDEAEKE